MPIVKRLKDRVDEKKKDGKIQPRAIIESVISVVKDGDVDADDFDDLVDAVKQVIAYGIPLINVPYIPDALEAATFDSWAIPLAQSYADELVAAAYDLCHIPLPESHK